MLNETQYLTLIWDTKNKGNLHDEELIRQSLLCFQLHNKTLILRQQ